MLDDFKNTAARLGLPFALAALAFMTTACGSKRADLTDPTGGANAQTAQKQPLANVIQMGQYNITALKGLSDETVRIRVLDYAQKKGPNGEPLKTTIEYNSKSKKIDAYALVSIGGEDYSILVTFSDGKNGPKFSSAKFGPKVQKSISDISFTKESPEIKEIEGIVAVGLKGATEIFKNPANGRLATQIPPSGGIISGVVNSIGTTEVKNDGSTLFVDTQFKLKDGRNYINEIQLETNGVYSFGNLLLRCQENMTGGFPKMARMSIDQKTALIKPIVAFSLYGAVESTGGAAALNAITQNGVFFIGNDVEVKAPEFRGQNLQSLVQRWKTGTKAAFTHLDSPLAKNNEGGPNKPKANGKGGHNYNATKYYQPRK